MTADFEARLRARRELAGIGRAIRGERCADGCESRDRRDRARGADVSGSADSASMRCADCGLPVCIRCQRAPVAASLMFCDPCGDREASGYGPAA
jgi:hypothetical protein